MGDGVDKIVSWVEFLSESGVEFAVVDGAANLEQEIGAAPRPAHLLRFVQFIRRFTRKLAVPSVMAVPTRNPARCLAA